MKKFICLSLVATMLMGMTTYATVINRPNENGNIVDSSVSVIDTNSQVTVIADYLKQDEVSTAIAKEKAENTKKSEKDFALAVTGGNIYFNKATGMITGCDDSVTKVSIPLYIDKTLVLGIEDYAFFNCPSLTEVTMFNEIKTVGKKAFAYSGLKKITLSSKITAIGESAFTYCPFTSVTLPKDLTTLGANAFEGSALNNLTIPSGVTAVATQTFKDCGALKTVGISSSAKEIGNEAFINCTGLVSVTVPASVETIGDSAFSNCGKLISLSLNEGLKYINKDAFGNAKALTSVNIPFTLTNLDATAFTGSGLKTVYVSNRSAANNRQLYPTGTTVKVLANVLTPINK